MRSDNKAAISLDSERRQAPLDFVCVMHTERDWLDLERRGQGFSNFEKVNTGRRLGIHHESDAFDLGRGLLEQLQPFPA